MVTATDTLTYQCVIEGYSMDGDSMPRIADFKAHYKAKYTQTNTVITQPIIKPQKRNKWLHIQPQITAGFDPINKQWAAVVGFGVGVDI